MNNKSSKIEVGDKVRLVKVDRNWKGYVRDLDALIGRDIIVKKLSRVSNTIGHEGWWYPVEWFEVMEGANEPKINHNDWYDQLGEVMECEAELQRFKDLVWRLSLDYHEGEIKGWHFLRAVQGVMAEYIREDVNGIYED